MGIRLQDLAFVESSGAKRVHPLVKCDRKPVSKLCPWVQLFEVTVESNVMEDTQNLKVVHRMVTYTQLLVSLHDLLLTFGRRMSHESDGGGRVLQQNQVGKHSPVMRLKKEVNCQLHHLWHLTVRSTFLLDNLF